MHRGALVASLPYLNSPKAEFQYMLCVRPYVCEERCDYGSQCVNSACAGQGSTGTAGAVLAFGAYFVAFSHYLWRRRDQTDSLESMFYP